MSTIRPFAELALELRTPRLVLRPLEATDVEALWPHVSDPDLPYFMTWETHRDRAETAQFLAMVAESRAAERGIAWGIHHEGALCGVIGLEGIRRQLGAWQMDSGEIGFWVGRAHRNRGIITEATREVVRFGFEDLGLHKILIGHVAENVASQRVIEKVGFRYIGVRREHLHRHGRWWDHRDYELLDADWRAMSPSER